MTGGYSLWTKVRRKGKGPPWPGGPSGPLGTIDPGRVEDYEAEEEEIVCPPSLLQKTKGIRYFGAPGGARGQRRASRNPKAVVFSWFRAGPQAFRLSWRKRFWDCR